MRERWKFQGVERIGVWDYYVWRLVLPGGELGMAYAWAVEPYRAEALGGAA
ncbi:hypothetical protein SEA_VULPECULA_56 [Arthrobacter phage Vulpecula]|nr:hypothetical protein SEA_VULPECULA_56 [Arthrobacter phage Vulpecula]